MTNRPLLTAFGLTSLVLLCMAEADRGPSAADRGSRGASAPSRPSAAPSRPSSPAPSRPAASAPASRPSAPAARPSAPAPRASAPAPSRPSVSAPSRPSAPSAEPRSASPRSDSRPSNPVVYRQPRADSSGGRVDATPRTSREPRYEQPRNAGGRTEQPRPATPDVSGRSSQPAPERPDVTSRGGDDGVWRPEGGGSYEITRRAPRTPIPTLVGSPRSGAPVAGTPRPGLSSRTGRTPDLRSAPRGTGSTAGEGRVRLPHTEITHDSILQRYRGRENADRVLPTRAPTDNDLSRARGARQNVEPATANTAERAQAARDRAAQAPRGSVEAARRERESVDNLERLRRDAPWRAKTVGDAGDALTRAADVSAQIAVGVGVGFSTGAYCGWFWEPTCSPYTTWPWYGYCGYWGWGCWPYGWGCSWYGWNSYYGYPYYCYPYSYSYGYPYYGYSGYSAAPVYYTTVVNDTYADDGSTVVYEEPAVEDAGYITAAPSGQREGGEQNPEVKAALIRGASDYLKLGDEAFRQGRYSDAVHHYARTVEYAPDDGVLYLLLSDALFATGDYHYAAFALRRAIELEPKIMDNVIDKHGFYGDPLEYDKQIALAEQYLNEHFLDEDARLILAANYLFAKRPAQCVDLLESPFSQAVLESPAGRRIHERALALRQSMSNTGQK